MTMKNAYKFTVRETRQRLRDGKSVETVRLDPVEPADGVDVTLSLTVPTPSGYKPGQAVTLTVETSG